MTDPIVATAKVNIEHAEIRTANYRQEEKAIFWELVAHHAEVRAAQALGRKNKNQLPPPWSGARAGGRLINLHHRKLISRIHPLCPKWREIYDITLSSWNNIGEFVGTLYLLEGDWYPRTKNGTPLTPEHNHRKATAILLRYYLAHQ